MVASSYSSIRSFFCVLLAAVLVCPVWADNEKTVRIKVAQYAANIDFVCKGGGAWDLGGKKGRLTGTETCKVTSVLDKKAVKRYHVMTVSVRPDETAELDKAVAQWRAAGWRVRVVMSGRPLYTEDGKTLINDNRRANIEVGVFDDEASAQALVDRLASQGKSAWISVEIVSRAQGRITLEVNGAAVAEGDDLLIIADQSTLLKNVEYAVGYSWHGFADRSYRGPISIRFGAHDALDCVLSTGLEAILAGVVPSEISANAQIGALQAQAVAARGEILAKIGGRHAGEGFDTCSEQHCQVFAGESAAATAVAQKIAPTRGVVLGKPAGGLVDAVYAANCGGHSEACHYVWSTPADPILVGVWDCENPPSLDLSEEEQVGRFIKNPPAGCFCADPAAEGSPSFRWQKSITGADWTKIESAIGVGKLREVTDLARGFSGRIYRMTFVGSTGKKTVMKELNIRKLFGGLKSACFVATWQKDAAGNINGVSFTGAGFGHGVGMCQTGAQSQARRGWSFDKILLHYFKGAQLKNIY